MVKSETLFCRLISIDTLLSFNGIIPSAADFQLRITSLIERLNQALLAEDQEPAESESLCKAVCSYFDKRLSGSQQQNALSWQRYSLVHYFYGYNQSEGELNLAAQLDILLSANSDVIFSYAWKLLALLIQIEGQTTGLVSLRAASRSRYLSQTDAQQHTAEAAAVSWIKQKSVPADLPLLMVFVIGPFAAKWFNSSDLSTSNNSDIVWVVVEHATSLAKRLAYLTDNYSAMATLAYFPLLADGFENAGVMIEQITAWQHALSATQIVTPLPCMLGLYTRLSQQRYAHDPDRAIWTGGLASPPYGHLKLEPCLVNLIAELDSRDDSHSLYAIQRQALGSTLILFLAESRIMAALQHVFDRTALTLAGVILADHGQGFTRHGAWSQWLAGKYGILPGLAASITIPPLPPIALPSRIETEQSYLAPLINATKPKGMRRHKANISLLLILLIALGGSLYYLAEQDGNGSQWITSVKTRFQESSSAENAAVFELSGTEPLFEIGSSRLVPESEKMLEELVPKIVQMPQQVFLIVGHSDNTGSAAVNLALSTQRAQFIRNWLVEHTGLPDSQFIIKGAGNSRPVANNDTQAGRAQNRRVEIIPLSMQGNQD